MSSWLDHLHIWGKLFRPLVIKAYAASTAHTVRRYRHALRLRGGR
jgi:hypothetical protein